MQTKKIKMISIVLMAVCIALVARIDQTKAKELSPARITVTDMAERKVSVNMPVKKVVLGYAKEFPTLAAVAGETFPEIIVGWGLSRSVLNQGIYIDCREKFHRMEDIPDVGSHAQGTYSVEKVISLKPDVVLFPLWILNNLYEGVEEDITRMEQAGIPTVFLDFWEKPLEKTIPSTLLLGNLLGKEKIAQEIVDFCQKQINEVTMGLGRIKKSKPRVYVENGAKDPSEYGFTCGNYAWGIVTKQGGGINIAEGLINRWGQINPEYLMKIDPEVIIIAEPKGLHPIKSGYQNSPEESRMILQAFTERAGWSSFSAVKKGRVNGVFDSFIIYNTYNFAAIEAVAKWLYPDDFKDLDPEANLKAFFKKFLSIDYDSRWMIGI